MEFIKQIYFLLWCFIFLCVGYFVGTISHESDPEVVSEIVSLVQEQAELIDSYPNIIAPIAITIIIAFSCFVKWRMYKRDKLK